MNKTDLWIKKYLNEGIDLDEINENKNKAFKMVIDNLGLPETNTKIYKHIKDGDYELMVVKFKDKFYGMEIKEKQPQTWEGDLKTIKKQIMDDTGVKI